MSNKSTKHSFAVALKTKLLLVCGALILGPCSFAFKCVVYPVEHQFNDKDVVFTGTVESISDAPETYNIRWSSGEHDEEEREIPSHEVKLKVEDVWKGKLDKEVLVYTVYGPFSTGNYPFKVKGRYVVFANFRETDEDSKETEKYLRTSWCSGNIGLGDGDNDVDLEDLSINILHRKHGELETETTLVAWLGDLRSKLDDSDSTVETKEDTEQ